MSRKAPLPQDYNTSSNQKQELNHDRSLTAATRTVPSNNDNKRRPDEIREQEGPRTTGSLIIPEHSDQNRRVDRTRTVAVDAYTYECKAFVSHQDSERYTKGSISLSDDQEKKIESTPKENNIHNQSGRHALSQDIMIDLHPLHQLSDIALKQLETLNASTTTCTGGRLLHYDENATNASFKIIPEHKETQNNTRSQKKHDMKSTNDFTNGEKKDETEKSKLKSIRANLRKGKWTVSYSSFQAYRLSVTC
jgi:hypothetical protein